MHKIRSVNAKQGCIHARTKKPPRGGGGTGPPEGAGGRAPQRERGPGGSPPGPLSGECPPPVSGVLLSHGLSPQYHRRSGA